MKDIDKYVDYVLAQVSEGGHSKKEIEEDLKERGLSDEEIKSVIQLAWMEGKDVEEDFKSNYIVIGAMILTVVLVLFFTCYILDIEAFNRIFRRWGLLAVGLIGGALFYRSRFK